MSIEQEWPYKNFIFDKFVYSDFSEPVCSVSQKTSPLKIFFAIFSLLVYMCSQNYLVFVQSYFYVGTKFGPFTWRLIWTVSVLLVSPLKF